MSNAMYTNAKTQFLLGNFDWVDDDFTVLFMDDTYAYDAGDLYWSDVEASVIDSAPLLSKTVVDNVCDAADVTTVVVPLGVTLQSLIIVRDTADHATSELLLFMDQNDTNNFLARLGEGVVIPVLWSNGPGRIFRIV